MRRFQPGALLATRKRRLAVFVTALAMVALVAVTLGFNVTRSSVEAKTSGAPITIRPSAVQPQVVASGVVDLNNLPKFATQPVRQAPQQVVQPLLPSGQTAASRAAYQNSLRHMKGVPVVKGQPLPTQLATVDNTTSTDGISPKFIGGTQLLPSLSKSFDGLNATQTDGAAGIAAPSIAVNLGYAVEAAMGQPGNAQNANSGGIAIYSTNTGALAYGPYHSHSFFAPIYTPGNSLNDPQVLYDTSRDRWIIVYVEWNVNFSQSWLDVAISQTISPTQPIPGSQYYEYKITANPFNSPNANICHWPRLGMDYWGLWITCVSQDNTSALYAAGVFALNKNQFYAGTSGYVASWAGVPIDTICGVTHCNAVEASPAVEDGTPDAEWIVANNQDIPGALPSTNLTLCAATNTIGLTTAALPTLSCNFNTLPQSYAGVLSPLDAPCVQPCPGSTFDILANMNQVVYRGSRLFTAWTTAAMFDGDSENRDGVYWLEVLPQLSTRAAHNPQQVSGLIVQNQGIYGYKGAYAFSPTLAPSAELDEALVFNFSTETTTPSIVFTARRGSDAPNTMGQGSPNGASAGIVWGTHSAPSIWGPFSSCSLALNSVTRGSLWCAAEYEGSDNWNTRIFAIRME